MASEPENGAVTNSAGPAVTRLASRARRVVNGVRKVAAGLRLFGESVWPGVRNDLFVAHASIYELASRLAAGAAVLDAGCGTGYGSRLLAVNGAARVFGADIDPLSVAYARRHFSLPGVTFSTGDCESVAFPRESFDLVVASNVLEHLERPEAFARSASARSPSTGCATLGP